MAKNTDLGTEYGTETDPGYNRIKGKQEKSEKAKNVLRGAGYARGGGVSPARKHGGKIDGGEPVHRADKFARGGSAPKGHHARTKININIGAGQAEKQQAMAKGLAIGKMMAGGPRPGAGAPMQARPPMPPPGGAPVPGPGPGAMTPGGPPPMANRGGRFAKGGNVKSMTGGAGSGGGAGRLAKIKSYGPK